MTPLDLITWALAIIAAAIIIALAATIITATWIACRNRIKGTTSWKPTPNKTPQ